MSSMSYFETISDVMDLEAPPAITVTPLRNSIVQLARMTSGRNDHGLLPTPVDDSLLLTLEFKALPEVNIWLEGRHHKKGATKAGEFALVPLGIETLVEMDISFDSLEMVFPRAALAVLAEEHEVPAITTLSVEGLERSYDDAVVRNLACSLLPAFENPVSASQLFIDHVALAMLTYMAEAYGGLRTPTVIRGGLAPWQTRRVIEFLADRLNSQVSLSELAQECGLSRGHFARSFKRTMGKPPHRWLVEKRLERAKELMIGTRMTLGEVADACGFSDQSHLTRSFSSATGCSPAEWRRIRKL